jgi:exopolysaccharide biosynthesis polyprenyl glycosylphosphotransferase
MAISSNGHNPPSSAESSEQFRRAPGLAVTVRNVVILRAVRDLLAAAAAAQLREAAIRSVEKAAAEAPTRPPGPRAIPPVELALLVLDVAAFAAGWLLAARPGGLGVLISSCGVFAAVAAGEGLYRFRLTLSTLDDVPELAVAAVLAAVAAWLSSVASGSAVAAGTWSTLGISVTGLLVGGRLAGYAALRRLRSTGHIAHPTLIVGNGQIGRRLAAGMATHPEYGLALAGVLDVQRTGARADLRPASAPATELSALAGARASGVRDVVFAFSSLPDTHLIRAVRACRQMNMRVWAVPRYFEMLGANRRARIETLWGVPLVLLRRWPLHSRTVIFKRACDVLVSAFFLLLLSPVLAGCAVAVRIEGGPGVIFRQVRIGQHGKPFVMYKFRSLRPRGNEGDCRWTIDGDAAVGRVGRFLRRSGLDELPQLVNILRGDMSLVGPRPERPYFAEEFARVIHRYTDRLRLVGGLTGWAQVNGLRGDTSIEDRISFDNYYIDNWSLWSDIKIILRTMPTLARRSS